MSGIELGLIISVIVVVSIAIIAMIYIYIRYKTIKKQVENETYVSKKNNVKDANEEKKQEVEELKFIEEKVQIKNNVNERIDIASDDYSQNNIKEETTNNE